DAIGRQVLSDVRRFFADFDSEDMMLSLVSPIPGVVAPSAPTSEKLPLLSHRSHASQYPLPSSSHSHACCAVVSNGAGEGSALGGSVAEVSAAPPTKPAIACTSWPTLPELSAGGSTAKPPSCQSKPTAPKLAAPTRALPAMS